MPIRVARKQLIRAEDILRGKKIVSVKEVKAETNSDAEDELERFPLIPSRARRRKAKR